MVQRQIQELDTAREEVERLEMNSQEPVQRVEFLTADCHRIQKERESIRRKLDAEIEQLKVTNAMEAKLTKKTLEEFNHDRTQAYSEISKTRNALDVYADKVDNSVRETEALRHELSDKMEWRRRAAELEHYIEIRGKELGSARHESSTLKKEFHKLETVLEDRTSELKDAQCFLTTADAFSRVEVISVIQRLNADVLQSTAFMAESMVEQFYSQEAPL